jgi:hypothetical protein
LLPAVRIFGTDKDEITSLDAWFAHAPPEGGLAQWRDGYSAKEQAKAWLRPSRPAVPEEWWQAVGDLLAATDEIYSRPEHQTRLDRYSGPRHHDLLACGRRDGTMTSVIGVEAKACEGFDGTVADRRTAAAPSNKRARCNLLARALFGRPVIEETTGELLDEELGSHGYQLWTAAVGTLIEAQSRGALDVVLVVHQFRPADSAAARLTGDARDWDAALTANTAAISVFTGALAEAGGVSHQTEFVAAGTRLSVVEVDSLITA